MDTNRVALVIFYTLLTCWCWAQDKGEKIVFHVTSVRSEDATDYCTTGKCSATRFTVEGYSDVKGRPTVTEYVLECVETLVTETPVHYTVVCDRVHANNDYDATLYADNIMFGEPKKYSGEGPLTAVYSIKSEKETKRK